MFDVGFAELLLLSLIALLVLGPERLPKVARTLGGLSRKARASWLSLKRSIDEEMRQQDLKQPVDKMREDFRSTVDDFKSSVDEVKSSVSEVKDQVVDTGSRDTGSRTAGKKPETASDDD